MSTGKGKHRNKIKEPKFQEVEIKFSEYALAIAHKWVEKKLIDGELAEKLIHMSSQLIESHLMCNGCKNLFFNEEFYIQKAQYARRQRAQVCKDCWKNKYRWRK